MEYFVSIENTAYDRWQVELLIESFKKCNLQDYLCIAIARNDQVQYSDYSKNLNKHPRKIMHDNFEEKNNIFSLIIALDNDFIREPFALLRPHMILVDPVKERNNNVVWNVESEMNDQEKNEIQTQLKVDKLDPIINPGDFYIFKNCPNLFFHKIAQRMTEFSERLAIILTLYEYYGYMTLEGNQLETTMIHNEINTPIINYKHGYPPHWHRLHYKLDTPMQFSTQPYNDLLKINAVPKPVEYIQEIIKSYLKK